MIILGGNNNSGLDGGHRLNGYYRGNGDPTSFESEVFTRNLHLSLDYGMINFIGKDTVDRLCRSGDMDWAIDYISDALSLAYCSAEDILVKGIQFFNSDYNNVRLLVSFLYLVSFYPQNFPVNGEKLGIFIRDMQWFVFKAMDYLNDNGVTALDDYGSEGFPIANSLLLDLMKKYAKN